MSGGAGEAAQLKYRLVTNRAHCDARAQAPRTKGSLSSPPRTAPVCPPTHECIVNDGVHNVPGVSPVRT